MRNVKKKYLERWKNIMFHSKIKNNMDTRDCTKKENYVLMSLVFIILSAVFYLNDVLKIDFTKQITPSSNWYSIFELIIKYTS